MLKKRLRLKEHGLSLSMEKLELILLTRIYINLEVNFDVLGTTIIFKTELKFTQEIKYAAQKTMKVSELMANILYGCEVRG